MIHIGHTSIGPPIGAWHIGLVYPKESFDVSSEISFCTGVAFSNDGSKMYAVGYSNAVVEEYSLGTNYDIRASSHSHSLDISSHTNTPWGLSFKPDGTKMFLINSQADAEKVQEYHLSTAFDLSSASYDSEVDVSSEDAAHGITFNDTGSRMYLSATTGLGSGGTIWDYTLSTAFDVSTASQYSWLDVDSQDYYPNGLFFNPDGTKLFVVGGNASNVGEWHMDSAQAYNVSSATLKRTYGLASNNTKPRGLAFRPNGTIVVVTDEDDDLIYNYDLRSATSAIG